MENNSLKKASKKAIFAWSFDPFTLWHMDITQRSGEKFEKLIVWVGQNPDKKYMFSVPERLEMIQWVIKQHVENLLDIEVLPYEWLLVDFAYEQWASTIVRWLRWPTDLASESTLHWVWETQKLWIDTVFLLAKQEQTHLSSGATKAILKEQWLIEEYVGLNVKHFMEARMKWQYLVWITGSIGSWKSYVTQKFVDFWKENGIPVHNIDLDRIWHWILSEAKDDGYKIIRQKLVQTFWENIMRSDGFIERKALWEIVFNDSEKRKQLDEILYTPISLKIRKEISEKKGIILLNWALLAEAWMTNFSNNNLVLIWVDSKIQQERLAERWHTPEQIHRRVGSQFSTALKKSTISDNIDETWYGSLVEFGNNWDNDSQIKSNFNKMLCNVDIYWELRIKSVFEKLWMAEKSKEIFEKIKPLYDTSERLYHNWFHVVSCLNHLYEIKEEISEDDFTSLFFAIIFHDSIYDVKNKKWENEQNSAELAENFLRNLWIQEHIIQEAKNLILLTTTHNVNSESLIEKYMNDIDLSILWQDWEKYSHYSKAIRYEYASYTDEDYKKWRWNILKKISEKQIFQTPYFHKKYEKQAQENIQKEIELLVQN